MQVKLQSKGHYSTSLKIKEKKRAYKGKSMEVFLSRTLDHKLMTAGYKTQNCKVRHATTIRKPIISLLGYH